MYKNAIADLSTYKHTTLNNNKDYQLESVDFFIVSQTNDEVVIGANGVFALQIPLNYNTSSFTFAVGEDYYNYAPTQCNGTNPYNFPAGASGSGCAVGLKDGIRWHYNTQYISGQVYTPAIIQITTLPLDYFPNNSTYTNPISGNASILWLGTSTSGNCMSYSNLNEYMIAMNYVHEFQRTNINFAVPSGFYFVGFNYYTTYQPYSYNGVSGMVWQYESNFGYLTSTTIPVSQL